VDLRSSVHPTQLALENTLNVVDGDLRTRRPV
jgi:hypothetical protein